LAAEDDEKRALRERVEELKAHDVDRLEAELRKLSGVFNQRLYALGTKDRPANPLHAGSRARSNGRSCAFVEKVCLYD
jgi:hypothetical protein